MAKTYKKRHRHRRKFTRGGVGSLASLRAAKTIQSAFRTSSNASALRRRHSAKKIQRSAHKAFDFAAKDCTICLEKNLVKSKVAPISCGHGLHKQCLDDLLKSKPFEILSNRRCPMCRKPGPEFQVIPERPDNNAVLERQIREILEAFVETQYLPRELATPENINKLIIIYKLEIRQRLRVGSDRLQIENLLRPSIITIRSRWENLTKNLDTINRSIRNRSGQVKTRIGKATLESLRDRFLPFVISGIIDFREYDITIPATVSAQIIEIKNLFIEKNIDMPSQEQVARIRANILNSL